MIFRVSLLFISDRKLCHLCCRKLFVFVFAKRFYSLAKSNKKFLNYKYLLRNRSSFKMSSSASSSDSFQGKGDRFDGITVFSDREPCDIEEFPEKLKNSLEKWRSNGKRGIWFHVHLDQCAWVPILVKFGFKYHHAKEDYVMLYLWLPNEEPSNIPKYAHTMIGVGAVVINDRDQILVVKERYSYKVPMWKLPGGYVEPGENLVDASIREVLEETGIQTEFESVLSVRQAHTAVFGCSDLYFVVNLKAMSDSIEKCDREIAECQWMKIEEYLSHPHAHELNRFFVARLLHHRKHNLKIECHHGIHQILQIPYTVYSVIKTDDTEEIAKIPFSCVTGESSKSS